MTDPPVVADSSTLIGLEQIGRLYLFEQMFGGVVIPPAVARETANSVERRDWIRIASIRDPIPYDLFDAGLGAGETECIALALSRDVRWIVLDDRSARLFAESRHLPVLGALGLLRAAKISGYINSLSETIIALRATGFFAGDDIVKRLLEDVGEA